MKAKFTALYDGLRVDSDAGITLSDGEILPLPPKELEVLCLLMSERGQLVLKDRLLEEVWGYERGSESGLMRCVCSLRKRLSQVSPLFAKSIKTEFGRGYRFIGNLISSQLVVTDDAFYALIDASPDFIALKDGQGRWQAANRAGLTMYKLINLDWQGKSDHELGEMVPEFSENLRICHETDEQAWARGETMESIEHLVTPELELVFHVYKSLLFNKDGSRRTLVVHGRNVTKLLKGNLLKSV